MNKFAQYQSGHKAAIVDKITKIKFNNPDDFATVIAELQVMVNSLNTSTILLDSVAEKNSSLEKETEEEAIKRILLDSNLNCILLDSTLLLKNTFKYPGINSLFDFLLDVVADPQDPYSFDFNIIEKTLFLKEFVKLLNEEIKRLCNLPSEAKQQIVNEMAAMQNTITLPKRSAEIIANKEILEYITELNMQAKTNDELINPSLNRTELFFCIELREVIIEIKRIEKLDKQDTELNRAISRVKGRILKLTADFHMLDNLHDLEYFPIKLVNCREYIHKLFIIVNLKLVTVEALRDDPDNLKKIYMVEHWDVIADVLYVTDADTSHFYIKAKQFLSTIAAIYEIIDPSVDLLLELKQAYCDLVCDDEATHLNLLTLSEIESNLTIYCQIIELLSVRYGLTFTDFKQATNLPTLKNLVDYIVANLKKILQLRIDLLLLLPPDLSSTISKQIETLNQHCLAINISFNDFLKLPAEKIQVLLANDSTLYKLRNLNYFFLDIPKLLKNYTPKKILNLLANYEQITSDANLPLVDISFAELSEILDQFTTDIDNVLNKLKTTSHLSYLNSILTKISDNFADKLQKLRLTYYGVVRYMMPFILFFIILLKNSLKRLPLQISPPFQAEILRVRKLQFGSTRKPPTRY